MPVIMPDAQSRATASVGQRSERRMARLRPRSMARNSAKTAAPENTPRQNSMVIRSAWMFRTNRPELDQASAAPATSKRPILCCLCSAVVMGKGASTVGTAPAIAGRACPS